MAAAAAAAAVVFFSALVAGLRGFLMGGAVGSSW